MESKTVKQLRKIAKEMGLKGYSRLKKVDLIEFIEEAVELQKRNEVELIEFNDEGVESQNQGKKFSELKNKTNKQLRKIAKERGLKGYSRLKKVDLVKLLEQPHGNKGGSLLDEDFEFDAPVLIPEKRKILKKEIPQVIEENVETFSDWLNWLENVKDESVRKKNQS